MTIMTTKRIVILTESSSLQQGLLALTTAIPGVEAVCADGSVPVMWGLPDCDLVLLDMSITGGVTLRILQQIAARKSTRCIAFSDDVQQCVEAREAGADVALLKGYPAAQLVKIIEDLLGNQINGNEKRRYRNCFSDS